MPISTSSKVVVQLPTGPVKGFVAEEDFANSTGTAFDPDSLKLQLASGEERHVSVQDAKGIFFVKDFDGKTHHSDIRFHDGAEPAEYLWVRVKFNDGEVLEGMIDNSCDYILGRGFWITPTDPTSNNWLIYVFKTHMSHFEVLGMRQTLHRRSV